MRLGRRLLLGAGVVGAGLPFRAPWSRAADMKGFPHDPHGPEPSVRLAEPVVGTAGAIWRPMIDSMPPSMRDGLGLSWANGGPGLSQFELVSHRVDVAGFGPLGIAAARGHVGDLVMFGPALYSHGTWLVSGASPFRHPKDLVGRRVACPLDISETFQQANLAAACARLNLKRELTLVFGTPAANRAAFERQDVEALIAPEPMATDLVARGARVIATVADMWRDATGDTEPLFMVGMTAQRAWVQADGGRAKRVAQLIVDSNTVIRNNPAQLQALGVPGAEVLAPLYATEWDDGVFGSMERQIDAAVRVGILPNRPDQAVYVKL